MTYSAVLARLRSRGFDVYEDAAPAKLEEHIVGTCYGYRTVYGDNGAQLRIPRCQLDCYAQSRETLMSILDIVDSMGVNSFVEPPAYDDEAKSYRMIVQFDDI